MILAALTGSWNPGAAIDSLLSIAVVTWIEFNSHPALYPPAPREHHPIINLLDLVP